MPMYRMGQNPNPRDNFNEMWTAEEAAVQRILHSLRQNGGSDNVSRADYLNLRNAGIDQVNSRVYNIIDQMYDYLKPISETHFQEMMSIQRANFDKEC